MRRIVLASVTAVAVGTTVVVAAPGAWADEPSSTFRVTFAYDGEETNGSSHFPVVSGDGRVVAFASNAVNIVRRDLNDAPDIFVRDLSTGVNTRVSVATDGTPANAASYGAALSHDGRFVAFTRPPRTWCRTTPTGSPTSSSTTGRPAPRAG
jgi:Tol biopolymer transport system component